jgi:hypothetical protein
LIAKLETLFAKSSLFFNLFPMYKKYFRNFVSIFTAICFSISGSSIVSANDFVADVVINEISWAGTEASSSDEWLELYNTTNNAIDLTGWTIRDDIDTVYELEGTLPANGYFVVEDSQSVISNYEHYLESLSFANTGDHLELFNSEGALVDQANLADEDWFAGDSASKASMERISFNLSGDIAESWATASYSNGSLDREGSAILGTPGSVNSTFNDEQYPRIRITSAADPINDQNLILTLSVENVESLGAFGFEIEYDLGALTYIQASEGDFLNSDGQNTTFHASLENNEPGKLIIGGTQLEANQQVNGEGTLFTLEFTVLDAQSENTSLLQINRSSFLSSLDQHLPFSYENYSFVNENNNNGEEQVELNTNAELDEEYYKINLTWDDINADQYKIYRSNQNNEMIEIGTTNQNQFQDSRENVNGLVSFVSYTYEVKPVVNGQELNTQAVDIAENRLVAGDINNSGRVDGLDLEILAKSFGSFLQEASYNPFTDLNYDGAVDGEDLIAFGLNFGTKF